MRKFMLITNFYKDRDLALSKRIAGYIREKGGTVGICTNNMDEGDGQVFDLSEIPRDTECILVLGGDGTLIRRLQGRRSFRFR